MSTESETILARYKSVEKEADALGRVIGVRRLKPSEQTKVTGMTPDLTGHDDFEDIDAETGEKTGKTFPVSNRTPLIIAASVCEIDDARIPFPRNRAELDAIFDRLDAEGLAAATAAFVRLIQRTTSSTSGLETAKN